MLQNTVLLFKRQPSPDFGAIKYRAEQLLGSRLDSPDPASAEKAFLMSHPTRTINVREGVIPISTALLVADEGPLQKGFEEELQQSWRCDDAAQLVQSCTSSLLVTEMMAQGLHHRERLIAYHGVLQAAIEVTRPDVVVFKHSQQVVTPSDYLDETGSEPILRPGALNVRLFNIEGTGGDMVMDTRGLMEIGLHDLQCHFRGLDQNEVARVLFNTGAYLVEKGAIIKSGQTVEGTIPGSRWVCQFEKALVPPEREVLNLNPGKPFAAGNRKSGGWKWKW
jgi:hypothetical protein